MKNYEKYLQTKDVSDNQLKESGMGLWGFIKSMFKDAGTMAAYKKEGKVLLKTFHKKIDDNTDDKDEIFTYIAVGLLRDYERSMIALVNKHPFPDKVKTKMIAGIVKDAKKYRKKL